MDCPNLRLWRWMNNNNAVVETGSPLQKLGLVHCNAYSSEFVL
jgi:hypothetical protein